MDTRVLICTVTLTFVVLVDTISGQTVRGRVMDAETGRPVATAMVVASWADGDTIGSTVTDSIGHFSVRTLRSGQVILQVGATGYRTVTTNLIDLEINDVIAVEIELPVSPIALEPLEVEATRAPVRTGTLVDAFYERKYWIGDKLGLGTFITRDAIESRNAVQISDILRTIPSLRFARLRSGGQQVSVSGGMCEGSAQIYVDGVLVNRWGGRNPEDNDIDLVVNPTLLEGIEVYRGGAQTPAEFARGDSRCGVIAMWTRRGR